MAELARLGSEVTIFCSDSGHHFFGGQGAVNGAESTWSVPKRMRLIRLRTWKYRRQRSLSRVLSWLDFEFRLLFVRKSPFQKPDVIIASSLSLLTVITGIFLSIRYQCKLIFEVRDIWPLTLVEEGGFSKKNPIIVILSWIEWAGYRWSDAIVGTMPNLAEHVHKVAASPAPVFCVPIGFGENHLVAAQTSSRVRPFPASVDGKFIVGYSGSFGVSNALETLLNCAAGLSNDNRIHFVLLGSGDLKSTYIRQFESLKNVSFLPAVSRNEVFGVLHGCDVLYFATQRSEVWRYGQSLNKLIDYMLVGKPILGSYSGHLSMVNEARCGITVPAEDVGALREGVLQLLGIGVKSRREMGERARQWVVANRSYTVLGARYQELISSLLASSLKAPDSGPAIDNSQRSPNISE